MFRFLTFTFFLPLLSFMPISVLAEGLPPAGLCPVISGQLAKHVAATIKGTGRCAVFCDGCGCKGGPGYRAPDGSCTGYANLIRLCGPPPHSLCQPECAPVNQSCTSVMRDVAWLKSMAASVKEEVSFVRGTFSFGVPVPANPPPK